MDFKKFQVLPAVDSILKEKYVKHLSEKYGNDIIVSVIRKVFKQLREDIKKNQISVNKEEIKNHIYDFIERIYGDSLKEVINATGVLIHTNLGRAPLGKAVLKNLKPIVLGYSNLELDLSEAKRWNRNFHISELVKFITDAEDAIVINNNAAGVLLTLNSFANNKEVLVSRGELIEIGGSFRMPDIMKASGAIMVDIGTTNRTKISDYENAITQDTKIILKAHKSNYFMEGFTQEVKLKELSQLSQKYNLIFVYDIGSGLLKKSENIKLKGEPDVKKSLKEGADIITFSCDKLLGGPQAGIIAGKRKYISKIARNPLMRTLRVGKLTISALSTVLKLYLKEAELLSQNQVLKAINTPKEQLLKRAKELQREFGKYKIKTNIIESPAKSGGGTMPKFNFKSYSVALELNRKKEKLHEKIFNKLLTLDKPIIGILRKGNIQFDIFCIFAKDIPYIARSVNEINNSFK